MTELETQTLLRDSILRFNHAMSLRGEMNLRLAKRITAIIRIGMISLAVIVLAIGLLVAILAWQMQYIVTAMSTMNTHFSAMAKNMVTMRDTITLMEAKVQSMPTIVREIEAMDASMAVMNTDIERISQRMDRMNTSVAQVTHNVLRMSQTFAHMDNAVSGIGTDVNTMSSPMRMFNNFAPVP
jgi:methyl-accepting chemotaxis protein